VSGDESSSSTECTFFALLPRTLRRLHIATEVNVNDSVLEKCTVDLAYHLPNLTSFVLRGKGTNLFDPKSMPRTLRTISISGGHRVNFAHILSLLPECIEECILEGK
jgi:hypothetical protein